MEIKRYMGDRGFPKIKINEEWVYLGISEEKIINHIQIGDSIAKVSGSDAIKVWRKNENGEWNGKEYK